MKEPSGNDFRRVAVTGLGAVTPLGENFPDSWTALITGRDADAPLETFDTSGCRGHRAASARLPEMPDVPRKILRRLNRASRLALPAAREALAHAGLLDDRGLCTVPGLSISASSTAGGMAFGEQFFRNVLVGDRAHLFSLISRYLPQQQVLDLQRYLGIGGPSVVLANACASGANSIGHAADLIATGAAECVLAGGFEAIGELVFVGFDCLQATTTERCRPFDLNRSGLLLGEGAGFLVLESRGHAQARGATILAELTGYGHTTDFFHLTQPQPDGAALVQVMRDALRQAGVAAAEIGYINAHGTATPINDGAESAAYLSLLEGNLGRTRVSSTKAAIGHTLGAAGSIEAIFALGALLTGQLPPQLNLQHPIPEIAPALVPPGETRADLRHVMSVNLGFGGSNAALVFSK
jgi:3-oxoacyl-[acyl-carrier-protein] synthase II